MNAPLNHVACPGCGRTVDDRAVACPGCGEQIYVEHPGDITPTKHRQLDYPDQPPARSRKADAEQ